MQCNCDKFCFIAELLVFSMQMQILNKKEKKEKVFHIFTL